MKAIRFVTQRFNANRKLNKNINELVLVLLVWYESDESKERESTHFVARLNSQSLEMRETENRDRFGAEKERERERRDRSQRRD